MSEQTISSAKSRTNTSYIVKIAMMSALAYIVMFLEFALPIFPSFLKMDLSDIIPLIGALSMGPLAGMFIELVKNLLHWMTVSSTGGIGEIANFVVGTAFVMTAGAYYKYHKTKKGALIGMGLGTLAMIAAGAVANYFITIPFYTTIMPMDTIIGMSAKVIPAIKDKFTLVLYAFCPFNLLKGALLTVIAMPIYKPISPLLKKELTRK